MKVQQITQDNKQLQITPQFKGAGDIALRFFATNQAMGANAVDVAFMVIPRTASDAIRRGPNAGLETGRREASGTINHTLIGVYGIGAGAVAAWLMGINRKYGTSANQIMTAPETLNILAENKAIQIAENKQQLDYLRETLKNIRAFNPTAADADAEGFVKISEETIEKAIKILDSAILDEKTNFKKWAGKNANNSLDVAINLITADTGAQSKYILKSAAENGAKSETNLRTLLEDIYKVSEAFNKEKVIKAFEKQITDGKSILENDFVKFLSKYKSVKSIAGFALASGIGMSIQPINMYLTRKKTGQDGFVGVEGRTKDKSTGFKFLKAGSAAAFFSMVLATLNPENKGIKKISPKGFFGKMAFKGFWPTISQLKGIYGMTIISRILSTRDKDELREALTKDTLGFLSWLVLGDFVNKMVAEGMDKKLQNSIKDGTYESVMNRSNEVAEKGFWGRVFKSTLKNRDEIIIKALAENGVETVKTTKDGKRVIAKDYREMSRDLELLPEHVKKLVKKRIRILNRAQLAGYAFSGLVLGLGIPNLNIYITNKLDKKRKAEAEQKAAMAEKT